MGVGRSRCSGPSAPRGDASPRAEALGAWQGWVAAAVGFVIVDSAFPPQSTPGNSRPGEGRPRCLRRSGSRRAARTGAARPASVVPNWQLVCPSLTLEGISVLAVDCPKVSVTFSPWQTDPAKPGAAPAGEPEADEGAPAQLWGPRRLPRGQPSHLGHSHGDRRGGRLLGKYAWHLCKGGAAQSQIR